MIVCYHYICISVLDLCNRWFLIINNAKSTIWKQWWQNIIEFGSYAQCTIYLLKFCIWKNIAKIVFYCFIQHKLQTYVISNFKYEYLHVSIFKLVKTEILSKPLGINLRSVKWFYSLKYEWHYVYFKTERIPHTNLIMACF